MITCNAYFLGSLLYNFKHTNFHKCTYCCTLMKLQLTYMYIFSMFLPM